MRIIIALAFVCPRRLSSGLASDICVPLVLAVERTGSRQLLRQLNPRSRSFEASPYLPPRILTNILSQSVGIEDTGTKTLINGVLQIFNFVMALTSALFVDRIGRRKLFLISNAGMLMSKPNLD